MSHLPTGRLSKDNQRHQFYLKQQMPKSGASVPLIGFGHLLFKGVKEAVDKQGFIGTFYGGLESAAVGISGALIMGYLASLVFKSKMK